MIGAGKLDLSVKFPFVFRDFVAVQNSDAEKKWKFDMRRDLGIDLGDTDDTKRGFLILNPTTSAVQVRLDSIKHELTDQMLQSYYDLRRRLSDARPSIIRIKDTNIDFELLSDNLDDLILMEINRMEVQLSKSAAWLLVHSCKGDIVPHSAT